jgi:hypothetical protein
MVRDDGALPLSDGGQCSAKAASAPHWPLSFSKKVALRSKLGTPARRRHSSEPLPSAVRGTSQCIHRGPVPAALASLEQLHARTQSLDAVWPWQHRRLLVPSLRHSLAHSPKRGTCSAAYPMSALAR